MHFKEALAIALRSLQSARLRTALTALGVVVGVAAVIFLVGLGNGMRDGFNRSWGQLSTAIIISKTNASLPGANPSRSLTEDDVAALQNKADTPDIASVTPLRNGLAITRYQDLEFRGNIAGTTPTFLQVRNHYIVTGRMFTDQENADRKRVAVIGPKIVQYLFGGDNNKAVGSQVYIGRLAWTVIGVTEPGGDDQDAFTILPINSARGLFAGSNWLNGIGVMAPSVQQVPAALAQINKVLDKQHNITDPGFRDYVPTALLIQIQEINKYLTLLNLVTLSVGAICLVIGTLGVANIMLVTVNNRTREIGIRKAIGARRSAIMRQFLIESVVLAGLGGVIGALLGMGLVIGGAKLLPRFVPQLGAPAVTLTVVFVVFSISLVIGLVAGCYPAIRAARMHPIDALRF
ncbi:MAG TPA: ABC transporter permease [Pseudonocardia sp.]|jgi:putative ABC transport system permease protein|nr:ABC transporter permease [Pseudonocardia sp.]